MLSRHAVRVTSLLLRRWGIFFVLSLGVACWISYGLDGIKGSLYACYFFLVDPVDRIDRSA